MFSFGILGTNVQVEDDMVEFCIFRMNHFVVNEKQDKKIILVTDYDVLETAASVGQKIGNPLTINPDGSVKNESLESGMKHKSSTDSEEQPLAKKSCSKLVCVKLNILLTCSFLTVHISRIFRLQIVQASSPLPTLVQNLQYL